MSECKYLKIESIEKKTLGNPIYGQNRICKIKEEKIDTEKIESILSKEIEKGCLGGGSGVKFCLFNNLKDCSCNEK